MRMKGNQLAGLPLFLYFVVPVQKPRILSRLKNPPANPLTGCPFYLIPKDFWYTTIVIFFSIVPFIRVCRFSNSIFSYRTLISGETEAGFTIFWADDGLDTGPILLQESCPILKDDTVDSLYKRFLYPSGIEACVRAVGLIFQGDAPKKIQDHTKGTYDAMLNKEELQMVNMYSYT